MAELDEKWPENVKGKFYVDEQCIDCDLCRETAPDFFTRNEDGGYSFVHKQPESADDIELCMEALEGCPVEAIGEDLEASGAKILSPAKPMNAGTRILAFIEDPLASKSSTAL